MKAEEGAPSQEETTRTEEEPSVKKSEEADEDGWGKFYSMPPKWKTTSSSKKEERDDSQSNGKLTDENIGHKLASLLRYHLGEDNGIDTDENGWVVVTNVIEHADQVGLRGCTAEDLVRVAESNEHSTRGKRFESDGAGRIRAKYRHPPKDRDRWDRDSRDSRYSRRSRGGYNGWYSNSWQDDYSKWKDGWQDQGDDTWSQWKKPGFSPSPDDAIVKASSWEDASKKTAQADAAAKSSSAETTGQKEPQEETAASGKGCEWEQWFTPEAMEMYYYNTKTEELFFPGDSADCQEKGWFRYVDTDGEKEGKIYWWHEATDRSFYEEAAIGDADAEA